MNEVLAFVFLSLWWVLALLIPLALVTWLAVGSRVIWFWVAVYFILIFYFPNASWGLIERESGSNFYTRGTGMLYFSAINLLLFGLAAQAFLARRLGAVVPAQHNLRWPALIFGLILLGNVLVGLVMQDVRWFQVLSASGLLNIANLMFAFYVLIVSIRDERDLDRFVNILLICAASRGIWGLVRFIALGGDPANFYSNFQHIDVRLTFFDINDSLIATLAIFVAGWRLTTGQVASMGTRLAYGSLIALELFIVVFSYRRTAWGGLVLAAILFAICQRRSLRNGLLASYVLVGLPAVAYILLKRAGSGSAGLPFIERVLPDVFKGGQINFTSGRFAELYAAFLSIRESPIWGLGAWGRYDGFRFGELAWHRGDFSWMHSGVVHIMLKTGLIGLGVMLAVMWGYLRYVRINRKTLPAKYLGLLMAGAAGTLFMLPNWLIGTPVIEFRTMQLMALCLALPYLAVAAANRSRAPGR